MSNRTTPATTEAASTGGTATLQRESDCSQPRRLLPGWLRQLQSAAIQFAFPPVCVWCGDGSSLDSEAGARLCPPCTSELIPPLRDQCRRCSAPVGPNLDTSAGCSLCAADRFSFSAVVSLGVHRGELRRAIVKGKYTGGEVLTMALADQLCRLHQDRLRQWQADLVVPVPHHWTERLVRSHLPPTTIAEGLGRFLMAPVARHILAKRRRTPPQTACSATQRRRNLTGAFRICGAAKLTGQRVLLVDDVLTTGTTAHRAARVLLDAGARQVNVAVLARGIGAEQPRPGLQ